MITLTPSSALPNTYSLNWSTQQSHIFDGLKSLVGQDDILTDVTLCADGEYIGAHKLVLALCSQFFKDLLIKNKADKQNTIIIVGSVSAINLRYLIQFMYQGTVDIPSKDVDSFLQAGNLLKVEGLIGGVTDSRQVDSNVSHHHHQSMASTVHHRPPRAQNASTSSKVSVPSPIDRESPPTPNKKPRLNESGPPGSGILGSSRTVTDIDVPPIIVSQPVTLSTTQDQPSSSSVMDPLDDSEHYEGEEGDVEEGIDFNNLKTEPIQVYSGYEESDQSEMMHNESVGEDSYGGSLDDNYILQPQPPSALQMASGLPDVSVPGPSSNQRQRANIPGLIQERDNIGRRSIAWLYFLAVREGDFIKYRCKLCDHSFAKRNDGGTSNLVRHLRQSHAHVMSSVEGKPNP